MKGLYQDESAPDVEEIRSAARAALDNLVDLVLSEDAPVLIIAGDLYDGDWKDFSTGLYFAGRMLKLAEEGVRVAVVRGNHDAENKMTRTLPMPENVRIFSSRKPETWILEDLNLALHGQSYPRANVTENLALDYPEPVPGMLNVGILHCLISGAAGHASYAPCTADQLAAKGYDYWALGHVHEHSVVREQPRSSTRAASRAAMSGRRDKRVACLWSRKATACISNSLPWTCFAGRKWIRTPPAPTPWRESLPFSATSSNNRLPTWTTAFAAPV